MPWKNSHSGEVLTASGVVSMKTHSECASERALSCIICTAIVFILDEAQLLRRPLDLLRAFAS